jgi:hypothetical protein
VVSLMQDDSYWICVPGRNSVTSYAFPCTITQHDSLELCFAISSPVRLPTSGFSLLGRFMGADKIIVVLFGEGEYEKG